MLDRLSAVATPRLLAAQPADHGGDRIEGGARKRVAGQRHRCVFHRSQRREVRHLAGRALPAEQPARVAPERRCTTWAEAEGWLDEQARALYPDSAYARGG